MPWLRVVAVLVVVLGGCFSDRDDYGNGDVRCEKGSGACPAGYVCAAGLCYRAGQVPTPDAQTGCVDNTRRCDGLSQQKCEGGAYVSVGSCDRACLEGFCVECKPDTMRCNENQPQRCNNSGGWTNVTACAAPTPLCETGACVTGCDATTKRCHPDNPAVQECDQQGIFRTVKSCPFVCLAAACGGECTPKDVRCGPGETPQTCGTMGTWENGTPCPAVCTGAGMCSGECRPGSTRCTEGNKQQTCDGDGQWGAGVACTFVCLAGEAACSGECEPGTKRCNGATTQQCGNDGKWSDVMTCVGGPCTQGECKPCTDNQTQCNADIPQKCVGGDWMNLQSQPCPFLCENGACTGVCEPGTYTCSGNLSRSCGQDATYTDTPCPFVCVAATGQCGGTCAPNSKRCSGTVSQTCEAGEWNAGTSCPNGCDAATGACGACVPESLETTCAGGGCGDKPNNCGAIVTCPMCENEHDTCGGGGVTGLCGCSPDEDPCAGHCGSVDDGCGGNVTCPACPDGGGTLPDAPLPPDGGIPDAPLMADARIDAPIGMDATIGMDACVDPVDPCAFYGIQCGLWTTPCGNLVDCENPCEPDQQCLENQCKCGYKEACEGTPCGPAIDSCQQTFNCACKEGQYCHEGKECLEGDCYQCGKSEGEPRCCCDPGHTMYCAKECPRTFSVCGGGCGDDPSPCQTRPSECGPVINKCQGQIDCGTCMQEGDMCMVSWDSGVNSCKQITCEECVQEGYQCCDTGGPGSLCVVKGDCPF